MNDSTKLYSSKQEHMIAEYLGWDVVPASGARHFDKGDIISADFLGECKTHVSKTSRIRVDFDVMTKLESEAMSRSRKPVLFVDNGTQTVAGTWAVLPATAISLDSEIPILTDSKFSTGTKSVSFLHKESSLGDDLWMWVYRRPKGKEYYAIMPLSIFRSMILAGDV